MNGHHNKIPKSNQKSKATQQVLIRRQQDVLGAQGSSAFLQGVCQEIGQLTLVITKESNVIYNLLLRKMLHQRLLLLLRL